MHERPSRLSPLSCRWLAALLILGTALARLVWFGTFCELDLAPDEGHYWDWSRHLDWSYYSKGPGVAWLIRLSCELFGGLSRRLTGTEMLAARLPAVVSGALLLVSLYVLTVQVFRREALALLVVALGLTTPTLAAGSSLITTDAPFTCCWGWALVFAHRAVFRGRLADWAVTGLLVGVGILVKYTMVVFVPSLLLFLLFTRPFRRLLASRGLLLLLALAIAGCVPILVWNAEHEWVTLRHVSGLAGVDRRGIQIHWLGPLYFVAVQAALWLVFWFVVWARAMWRHAPWRDGRPEIAYLWWMSAPMFALFAAFGLKTGGGEPNWPVTAYLSGLVLGIAWWTTELTRLAGWPRRAHLAILGSTCVVGLALTVALHHSAVVYPLLERLAGAPSPERPFPLRRVDPTLRLRGWRALAAAVDAVRHDLESRGIEPVLAGTSWSMPGVLGFYCDGHPPVYSLGLPLGDRRSQYDLWRPNPIGDAADFAGRTFLIVSGSPVDLTGTFERVEPPRTVTYGIHGQPVAGWFLLVAHGYRGFARDAARPFRPDY